MNFLLCRNLSLIALVCFFSSTYSANKTPHKKPRSERAENAKFVLANLAQMIGQIGTIVEEPRNADNVGNAVTNIVNNIVKITMHAVQNKSFHKKDAQKIMEIVEIILNYRNHTLRNIVTMKKRGLMNNIKE